MTRYLDFTTIITIAVAKGVVSSMTIYDARLSIIVIATTVVLFLIVFGVVLLVAGPAQSEGTRFKKRRADSIETDNLSAEGFEYGFETTAPLTNPISIGNQSTAERQGAQLYSEVEYGFENAASEKPYVYSQSFESSRQHAKQRQALTGSSYSGENFVVDKLGYGGKCKLCGLDVNMLFRFTLAEDGETESANLCAKCCKKLIVKIENKLTIQDRS